MASQFHTMRATLDPQTECPPAKDICLSAIHIDLSRLRAEAPQFLLDPGVPSLGALCPAILEGDPRSERTRQSSTLNFRHVFRRYWPEVELASLRGRNRHRSL